MCKHMIFLDKKKIIWTFENCKNEALKYSSKTLFLRYSPNAYNTALQNNWYYYYYYYYNY